MTQISTKPYMLRAIFEWCVDNGFTPYLAAKVDAATTVPMQFVHDGQIVLNISYEATNGLKMDNESIRFMARFGGVAREIFVPVENVVAIYANENGQGLVFDLPEPDSAAKPKAATVSPSDEPEPPKKSGPPTLTRVK
jgi:stringent starvation protein B